MAVATAVAVGGMAVSAYSANRQRQAGREASRNQQQAMDRQAELDAERLGFAREQYDDWRDMFRPVAEDLRTLAYEDRGPDYGAIAGDVGASFDTSQAMNRRQMERFGLQPGDGAVQDQELRYGIGRATAMTDAMNRARTAHKDQQFNRLAAFYGLGSGQGQAASSLINAAYAGASGNQGAAAGMYGNQAMYHQGQASQAIGDMAGWAGWGFGQYMRGQGGGNTHQQPHPWDMGPPRPGGG